MWGRWRGRWDVEGRERLTLTVFLEGKFTLLVVVFVLSTTTIFATLFTAQKSVYYWASKGRRSVARRGMRNLAYFSLILRHIGGFLWLVV